jgi:cellulose biosynthesis protein BcsQ
MQSPYVITISSEKGGVGKTTLATNLAIYLKALNEELPVTLFSFDNHFSVDRMFRIGKSPRDADVSGLFTGSRPEELLEVGEYGVQFIPSNRRLEDLPQVKEAGFDRLARTLATGALKGIVVIDTRPTLDILTRNALYAADRVIIPVKDAPSLENCKNLYDFCESQGISKRALRLLPCLIDSRIRYKGPFTDAYELLKAYAINRGYRCMEGYIAKSPKVESLNTNPEGRIYPIITHGRGTNVHLQFSHLARQILLAVKECKQYRIGDLRRNLEVQQRQQEKARLQLRERLMPNCLICGKPLFEEKEGATAKYYCETSDGQVSGYLEETCFSDLVFRHFYRSQKEISPSNPLRDLFRESAQRSYFVMRMTSAKNGFEKPGLTFHRFDEKGLEISQKTVEIKEFESRFLLREKTKLYRLIEATVLAENVADNSFLLIRRAGSPSSPGILLDEHRSAFERALSNVSKKLR